MTIIISLLLLFFLSLIKPSDSKLIFLSLILLNSPLFTFYDGFLFFSPLNLFHINFLSLLLFIFLLFHSLHPLIIFTNFFGLILLILSNDLLLIFFCLELINLTIYLLICHYSSGLKYFLFSSIMTTFLLFSFTLLYSSYGNLHLDSILSLCHFKYSYFGFLFLLLVLFFKLGLFPFHLWSPDLYHGISFPLMIYIHIILKFAFLLLFYQLHSLFLPLYSFLYFIGIFSMLLSTFLLSSQFSIHRFLAFSSISHLGFLILQFSYSFLFYLYIYSFTSLFLLILLYRNLSPLFITLLFLSLSGLPPLPGFFTKLYILLDLFSLHHYFLIFLILGSSLILAANYIHLGLIFFQSSFSKYDSFIILLLI